LQKSYEDSEVKHHEEFGHKLFEEKWNKQQKQELFLLLKNRRKM